VAGIIAGGAMPNGNSLVARQSVDASGRNPEFHLHPVGPICGMAPKCKLLSLRVLDDLGNGDVTSVINALEWLIQLNGDGSSPRVHGVNLSAGAASLGDLLTYYTMKDRAGIVGRTGAVGTVRALLKSRAPAAAPKVHLVGHSFGGRLVTSAANSLNGSTGATAPESVDSMMLLEAAYSHNGLAVNWDGKGSDGGFRSVIAQVKVKGPILISHSSHDFPVGTAYPIASRLRGQVADSLIGGPDDIYGGMGRNGAQHTPEVLTDVALASADGSANYPPAPNKPSWILNIRGDGPPPAPTITGHGDVAKPELVATLLNYI
jgi:pimeloyl-ACP methyl ester carboxylesterase